MPWVSLLSSVPLFFFSQLCFLLFLFWIDSLSPFCSVSFFVLLFLSLPPYVFLEHFQKNVRRKTEGDEEEEEEEGQGEESYQSRHRSELVDSLSKDRSIKQISSQLEARYT